MTSKQFICSIFLLFGPLCSVGAVELLPGDYESKTAEAKLELLFDHVKATEGTRGDFPNPFGYLRFLFGDDLSPTCDLFSDLIPYNHEKRIHSVGQVAAMQFESNGEHPYTGLFQGAPYALVRLSLAKKASSWQGTIPGLGVKFFRDGMPSANFVAMYSLDGQTSGNFFENDFTTHVNTTSGVATSFMANKFAKVSSPAEAIGLSDIASYTVEGNKVDEPIFPAELILVPNNELQTRFANSPPTEESLEEMMLSIPAETKLYDVHARPTPSSRQELIGSIKITSKLMYSSFGDGHLFFRHQRIEEDFELRPEWKPTQGQRGLRKRCPLGLDGFDD
eukprot:CAMPEP_0119014664 /NCGR_PEP_ID=MMETSP1176-20130426/10148_1 /TAXON_ID=265551 /ORGANISM="Synedropsis recta cf, Strain CCMP1620" /LENGTH=334 /DNA_ID=CAMNT_0006967879 /DNA_START=21 /DNA_END=1025 /DNA_ORIENTATION=+